MPISNDILSQVDIAGLNAAAIVSLVLTILIGFIAIRVIRKVADRLLSNTRLDERIRRYILTALKLLLYVVLIIIVMEKLNIKATSLVALLSVASLGLTLAAEDILGNMAGGLVILSTRPFAIGDFVEADGISGTVQEISLNHTRLATPDGLLVMVPNRTLSGSKVTNYTAMGCRRVVRKVTASYDAPTETVKSACRKAFERTDLILSDPEPQVYLSDYGASSIEYTLFCWTKPENYWPVYFGVGENLRAAFDEADVEMTYDHLNIHILDK